VVIRSAFVPALTENNPYQRELARHLAQQDVQVVLPGPGFLFLPELLRGGRPDVLHLHWLHPFFVSTCALKSVTKLATFVSQLIVLALSGTKIVWTVHNLRHHEDEHRTIDRLISLIVARVARGIIVHCEAAKTAVVTEYGLRDGAKVFVVPHGNYTGSYADNVDRATARRILGVPESTLVLLVLGRLRPYKGVLRLIEAFKRQVHGDAVLLIAGSAVDEALAERVRRAASEHDGVTFVPGFVPEDRVQVFMNASDVAVCPYERILTSGAVVLAMSFGKACIAPRMGCVDEILDEEGAFLYDPEEPGGLARAISEAIRRSPDLQRMGEHNRHKVEQWGWDVVARMTNRVYSAALGL